MRRRVTTFANQSINDGTTKTVPAKENFLYSIRGTAKMRGNIMGKFILPGLQKKERGAVSRDPSPLLCF
jgi:hypothetical protein